MFSLLSSVFSPERGVLFRSENGVMHGDPAPFDNRLQVPVCWELPHLDAVFGGGRAQ